MDMLDQNQHANGNPAQQGNDLVPLFIEAIHEEELRGGMAGVKKVFGDKAAAIE